LLVLDYFGTIKVTVERLALIGAIVGLIIIPFAEKLKILGVEFERQKQDIKEEKGVQRAKPDNVRG